MHITMTASRLLATLTDVPDDADLAIFALRPWRGDSQIVVVNRTGAFAAAVVDANKLVASNAPVVPLLPLPAPDDDGGAPVICGGRTPEGNACLHVFRNATATTYRVDDSGAVVRVPPTAETMASFLSPRVGGVATADGDTVYYLGGGSRFVLVHDSDGWSEADMPPLPRDGEVTGAAAADDVLYVMFDNSPFVWHCFVDDDNGWTVVGRGSMPEELQECTSVAISVGDDYLMAAGRGHVARLDLNGGRWALDGIADVVTMVANRYGNAVCVVNANGRHEVVEHCVNAPSITEIERLAESPRAHTLKRIADMAVWRAQTNAAVDAAAQRLGGAEEAARRKHDRAVAAADAAYATFTEDALRKTRALEAAAAAADGVGDIVEEHAAAKRRRCDGTERPREHYCPITMAPMDDPVVAEDGNSYERRALVTWLATKHTSPLTNAPMGATMMPSRALATLIAEF